tara:strand:- start:618 stop:1349 length:732 start_codon:yes stop_codon:yes gene_type:complete
MDAVYMISSESKLDDWELRYSLRSLEANYRGLERVWIIGHLPKWAKAISHIKQGDPYKSNKDANLISKVVRLGYEPTLSEKFIMMSDDHYFLQPSWDSDIKPYYNKDMSSMEEKDFAKDKWARRLWRTKEVLKKQGYPQRDYEGHIPYVLDKSKLHTYLNFDYGHDIGYCVFSLYFNTVDTPEIAHIQDGNVRAGFYGKKPNVDTMIKKMKESRYLNFNDNSFSPEMRKAVEKMFPKKSKYER